MMAKRFFFQVLLKYGNNWSGVLSIKQLIGRLNIVLY
jgi:hypothetical protein